MKAKSTALFLFKATLIINSITAIFIANLLFDKLALHLEVSVAAKVASAVLFALSVIMTVLCSRAINCEIKSKQNKKISNRESQEAKKDTPGEELK